MSITSKLLLTIFFCSAQQAKYSRHEQLIMIYRLLADVYKTVKIHHDNTEVKQIRRWRETVTVATASCVRAYENLDLHSSPVLCFVSMFYGLIIQFHSYGNCITGE